MKKAKKIGLIILIILTFLIGSVFFVWFQSVNSSGKSTKEQFIVIEKGDNLKIVAEKLQNKNLISRQIYFIFYAWKKNLLGKTIAGEYEIESNLKIPEILEILTSGKIKSNYLKITFPEGLRLSEMAEILQENKLDGEKFLQLAKNPSADILNQFDFLKDKPDKASLEGYLFPDTYFFAFAENPENLIIKMLKNFDKKLEIGLREKIQKQNKTIFEIITMSSIVEAEVFAAADRPIVSGIFWQRLKIEMPLQSDATVSYSLGGEKKIQHNAIDIKNDSPYNTYKFKGLPPGPINNPGILAIEATINPIQTDYLYFLNNPKTGKTFFSKTFEEHIKNKILNGL